MKSYIGDIPLKVSELNKNILAVFEIFDVLDTHLYSYSEEDLNERWSLQKFAKEIYYQRDIKEMELENKQKQFKDLLIKDQIEFERKLKDIVIKVDS